MKQHTVTTARKNLPHFVLVVEDDAVLGLTIENALLDAGVKQVALSASTEEALEPIRGSFGPWIVDDIEETRSVLLANGASIVSDIEEVPTGRMMYVKHADGSVVEYVQWTSELVEKHISAPLREGTPSSQI